MLEHKSPRRGRVRPSSCCLGSCTVSPHFTLFALISPSLPSKRWPVGVEYQRCTASDWAATTAIFRAGEFEAAQTLIPGAKGWTPQFIYLWGMRLSLWELRHQIRVLMDLKVGVWGAHSFQGTPYLTMRLDWDQTAALIGVHHLWHQTLAHYHLDRLLIPPLPPPPPPLMFSFSFSSACPHQLTSLLPPALLPRPHS